MDKHSPLTHIIVHNAHEHNLKNINLNLPKNKLVVITGVSGSGNTVESRCCSPELTTEADRVRSDCRR